MSYDAFRATRERNHGPLVSREYKLMQQAAMKSVRSAVDRGLLPCLSVEYVQCFDCTSRAECYDHWDYTKKLDVEPVCRRCNVRRGKSINTIGHKRTFRKDEMNHDKEWLASLDVGDKVAVREGTGVGIPHIYKVSRITPTQIVVGKRKYRKSDGRLVGASPWNHQTIQKLTPAFVDEWRERKHRSELGAALREATPEQLKIMVNYWRSIK